MRLIDADKLTELCDIMADKCETENGNSVWHQFRATVEWSPTVDDVPAREGRWLFEKIYEDEYGDEKFGFFCSECSASAYEFSQPYCHKCGAKMKEVKWSDIK